VTTLVVNPIGSGLTQEFTYNLNTRSHIAAFYPYLVMIGAPAGTFTFELRDALSNDTIFSKSFTSSLIKLSLGTANNYAHAFYPVIPDNPIQLEKYTYKIVITGSGYTETASSYIAWAQQFEDIQNEMSYTPSGDSENSLAFRLKIYKEGIN
jgi:hypothetical protein